MNKELSILDFVRTMGLDEERTLAIKSALKCGNSYHLQLTPEIMGILGLLDDNGKPILPSKVIFKYVNGVICIKKHTPNFDYLL